MAVAKRIIGIDPGLSVTGYAVIRSDGRDSKWLAHGEIKTSADDDMAVRLSVIFGRVHALLSEHDPDIMAVEKIFVAKNPEVAIKLGHARAAAICASFGYGIQVREYSSKRIKQSVVGYGAANKEQVGYMVKRLLNIVGHDVGHDAADAMAVALCHAYEKHPAESGVVT